MVTEKPNVWKVAPGRKAAYWDAARQSGCVGINWLPGTDLGTYPKAGDMRQTLIATGGSPGGLSSIWHFARRMRVGDIVVANRGLDRVVGVGVVTSEYIPPGSPANPGVDGMPHVRRIDWRVTDPVTLPTKAFHQNTVTPLDPNAWAAVKAAYAATAPGMAAVFADMEGSGRIDPPAVPAVVARMLEAVAHTRNIILSGPPGTGKTWAVQRFAGMHAPGRTTFVTFHPSYAYEEFVEGLRPVVRDGHLRYDVRPGVLRRACDRAAADPGHDHLLVIDEINRANVGKVFGELVALIEDDKRAGRANALSVTLPYSGDALAVPPNLTVVGTMNTADRSIALLDHALRRRFVFVDVPPDPGLLEVVDGVNLAAVLRGLNRRVAGQLDRDHRVGHSYFLGMETANAVRFAWYARVVPLLAEYFHGAPGRLRRVLGGAFVDGPEEAAGIAADFDHDDRPDCEVRELDGQAFLDALSAIGAADGTSG